MKKRKEKKKRIIRSVLRDFVKQRPSQKCLLSVRPFVDAWKRSERNLACRNICDRENRSWPPGTVWQSGSLVNRGFGFVTFTDAASVDKVLAQQHHELDSKTIDPKVAFPRRAQPKMVTRTKKIFVGGLSANTVVEDVKQYFEQFGKVDDAMLMFDKTTNRHRGFGFITFESEDIVEKVCEIHFHEINNKMVKPENAPATAGENLSPNLCPFLLMKENDTWKNPCGSPRHRIRKGYPNIVATYGRGYTGFAPSYSYQFPVRYSAKCVDSFIMAKKKASGPVLGRQKSQETLTQTWRRAVRSVLTLPRPRLSSYSSTVKHRLPSDSVRTGGGGGSSGSAWLSLCLSRARVQLPQSGKLCLFPASAGPHLNTMQRHSVTKRFLKCLPLAECGVKSGKNSQRRLSYAVHVFP
ncbi:hypothetical protein F2P81_008660 [Scophthalmus maximus]|uniref:RRM domain-containing protein n=1 Tax=Scophthalmus maximus TaxID=52904 RepID=A0A6A4SSK9_SCOMX|nr:hypothetical protein F2P81_008660 [Scophthalmus maximus]